MEKKMMMRKWTELQMECPVDIREEVRIAKEIEMDLMQLDWFPNYDHAINNLLKAKNNLQVLIMNFFHLIKIHKKTEEETEEEDVDKEEENEEETEEREGLDEQSFGRILKILDKKEEQLTSVIGGAIRIKPSNPQAISFKEEIQAMLRVIYHSIHKSVKLHPQSAELFSQHLNESLQDKFSLLGAETRDKKSVGTTKKKKNVKKKIKKEKKLDEGIGWDYD